jgi:hypothetical protein
MLGGALAAQSRGAAPEQSPRKALLEMLLGGDDALKKHLTLEVQRRIGESLSAAAPAGMNPIQAISMAKAAAGENLETYEAGPVLFSYENPAQHQKLEVRIDGDDLRGSEDQMRLSLHSFRNGVEEELPAALRFTLSWKAQQNVWRLNAVTVIATLPVGDPRLFDKARWTLPAINPAGTASATRVAPIYEVTTPTAVARPAVGPTVVEASAAAPRATRPQAAAPALAEGEGSIVDQPARLAPAKAAAGDSTKMTPVRAVRLIGLAEDIYAQKHPEAGFTCFLSELVNVGRGFEDGEPYKFMDPEFAPGVYNGYRFSLTGCAGSPAKTFQIVAEPLSGAGRAYCANATHELRGSDDGRGASCLASGKVVQR